MLVLKLIRGEFYKTIKNPVVYLLVVLVLTSLIFSHLTFTPQARQPISTPMISRFNSTMNASTLESNLFGLRNDVFLETDRILAILNFYENLEARKEALNNPGSETGTGGGTEAGGEGSSSEEGTTTGDSTPTDVFSITQINSSSPTSHLRAFEQAFNSYSNTVNMATATPADLTMLSDNLTTLFDKTVALEAALTELTTKEIHFLGEIIAVPLVNISNKLLEETLDKLEFMVEKMDGEFDKLTEASSSAAVLTIHRDLRSAINNQKAVGTVSENIKTASDLSVCTDLIEELRERIFEHLEDQSELFTEMLDSIGTAGFKYADFIKDVETYAFRHLALSNIVYNTIYLEFVSDIRDYRIQDLYMLETNPFMNLSEFWGNASALGLDSERDVPTTVAAINSQILFFEYMLENDLTDRDVQFSYENFSLGIGVGALDFAFHSIEKGGIALIVALTILAALSFSLERTRGTLKSIMSLPYKKWQLVLAKLLALFGVGVVMTTIFGVASLLFGTLFGGIDLSTTFVSVFNASTVIAVSPVTMLFFSLLSLFLKAAIFMSVGMFASIFFKKILYPILIAVGAIILPYAFLAFIPNQIPHNAVPNYIPFLNIDIFKFFGFNIKETPKYTSSDFVLAVQDFFVAPLSFNNNFFWALGGIVLVLGVFIALTFVIFNKKDLID